MAVLTLPAPVALRKAPDVGRRATPRSPKLMAAIGCSIAVHAIVLLGVSAMRATTADLPVTGAVMLITLEPPSAVDPQRKIAPYAPPAEARPDATPAAAGQTASPRSAPSRPVAVADAAEAPAVTAPPPAAQPLVGPAAPTSLAVRPLAASPAPAAAAEDPLAAYRRALWAELAAHAPAAVPGSGVATVVLGLDGAGGLRFVRLARSSGRPTFDRASLAAIREAAPFPPPPPGTPAEDLVFEVPIRAKAP